MPPTTNGFANQSLSVDEPGGITPAPRCRLDRRVVVRLILCRSESGGEGRWALPGGVGHMFGRGYPATPERDRCGVDVDLPATFADAEAKRQTARGVKRLENLGRLFIDPKGQILGSEVNLRRHNDECRNDRSKPVSAGGGSIGRAGRRSGAGAC